MHMKMFVDVNFIWVKGGGGTQRVREGEAGKIYVFY